MQGTLTLQDGTTVDATADTVHQHMGGDQFFWLDLDGVDDESKQLLLDGFSFHPLAVEDADHFGQRPKIEEYDGFTYFVVYGADDDALDEVHIFSRDRQIVTVRHGACAAFADARSRLARHREGTMSPPQIATLYLIVDELVDSFFPVLSKFDDRIDELEDQILKLPTEEQLGELFTMKRTLVSLRKVVTPQRDMFAGLLSGVSRLPGMTDEDDRYFRDLYDHLIRITWSTPTGIS